MLSSQREVIGALLRYTDWCQPFSSSVLKVGSARRSSEGREGFKAGLLETLDERTELSRRMALLEEHHRRVLFLWYIKQLDATEIARTLRRSRRQCFRLRARAVRLLVEQGDAQDGEPNQAA